MLVERMIMGSGLRGNLPQSHPDSPPAQRGAEMSDDSTRGVSRTDTNSDKPSSFIPPGFAADGVYASGIPSADRLPGPLLHRPGLYSLRRHCSKKSRAASLS